ncbi:GP88 family protein [Amycolatopsis sp.]|uniref:GP88 family protein n=1 Tax=Amycolatopsis sp. TaxID=37632 RepID=UPI002C3AE2D5|nr:hypothetical protein [Amycolatopsis sp.]HVV12130.1 hypothetical protein [Amycolatopsis sp.]
MTALRISNSTQPNATTIRIPTHYLRDRPLTFKGVLMPTVQPLSGTVRRPARLLTQNGEMKKIGAWNWSLPAWAGRLPDGRSYNTCPSAGVCAKVCYAHGTYTWPVVRAKHHANLMFFLDDPAGWECAMIAELRARKFNGSWVRLHDSGDFFSDSYTLAWLRAMRARPEVNFYAYTKEVSRFRRLVEPEPPPNFLWVYSYGGTQDAALDPAVDRVADVFPMRPPSARPAGIPRRRPTYSRCSGRRWSGCRPIGCPTS